MQRPGNVPADDLPTDAKRIAAVLRHCLGESQSITAIQIADRLGIMLDSPRDSRNAYVRRIIRMHRADFDFCVISSSRGFFRPADADELNHYERNIVSRIREMATGLSTAKKQARVDGWTRRTLGDWHLSD